MVRTMKPVIDFLKKLKRERDEPDEQEKVLTSAIDTASESVLDDLPATAAFTAPSTAPRPRKRTIGHISYSRSLEEIAIAKNRLGVTANWEVGVKTFEYFYRLECKE